MSRITGEGGTGYSYEVVAPFLIGRKWVVELLKSNRQRVDSANLVLLDQVRHEEAEELYYQIVFWKSPVVHEMSLGFRFPFG